MVQKVGLWKYTTDELTHEIRRIAVASQYKINTMLVRNEKLQATAKARAKRAIREQNISMASVHVQQLCQTMQTSAHLQQTCAQMTYLESQALIKESIGDTMDIMDCLIELDEVIGLGDASEINDRMNEYAAKQHNVNATQQKMNSILKSPGITVSVQDVMAQLQDEVARETLDQAPTPRNTLYDPNKHAALSDQDVERKLNKLLQNSNGHS